MHLCVGRCCILLLIKLTVKQHIHSVGNEGRTFAKFRHGTSSFCGQETLHKNFSYKLENVQSNNLFAWVLMCTVSCNGKMYAMFLIPHVHDLLCYKASRQWQHFVLDKLRRARAPLVNVLLAGSRCHSFEAISLHD